MLRSWTTSRAANERPRFGFRSQHTLMLQRTCAAAQEGLPETFLTKKIKKRPFCLGRLSIGGCCGEGCSKGGGGSLERPALLSVRLWPVRRTPSAPRHHQPFSDQMPRNHTEQLKAQGLAPEAERCALPQDEPCWPPRRQGSTLRGCLGDSAAHSPQESFIFVLEGNKNTPGREL